MARYNLQVKVGKYTGDGTSSRDITGIGFRPQLVIVKNGINNSVWRTKERRGDSTGFLTSSNTDLTTRIKTMLADGFQIGNAAQVNNFASVYYYIAIRGLSSQNYFRTGNYVGTGGDDRNFTTGGINFTPDLVLLQAISGSVEAIFKTSSMPGDTASFFNGTAGLANMIQNLQSNGFQLGTSTRANASGVEVFYFAMKTLPGVIAVGRFTGSGVARSITGLGFKPSVVLVKNYDTTDQGRILTSDMVTDAQDSLYMGNTVAGSNGILSLDNDGFSLGTSDSVNKNNSNIDWFALKDGNFSAPLSRSAV